MFRHLLIAIIVGLVAYNFYVQKGANAAGMHGRTPEEYFNSTLKGYNQYKDYEKNPKPFALSDAMKKNFAPEIFNQLSTSLPKTYHLNALKILNKFTAKQVAFVVDMELAERKRSVSKMKTHVGALNNKIGQWQAYLNYLTKGANKVTLTLAKKMVTTQSYLPHLKKSSRVMLARKIALAQSQIQNLKSTASKLNQQIVQTQTQLSLGGWYSLHELLVLTGAIMHRASLDQLPQKWANFPGPLPSAE